MARARRSKQVSEYVERLAAMFAAGGIPRMPARVFALLLATDSGRLTAAEIAEKLQVSAAAVSGAVRYLIQVDLISKESRPGSRSAYYRVHADVWHESIFRRDQMMRRWAEDAREGADLLGRDTPAGARLAETELFFEFVHDEMPKMLARWRKHRSASRTPPIR